MEDPKTDAGSQQGTQQKRSGNFRDSFVCYNNQYSSIRFGFSQHNPYVQMAAVLDNMRGKRPVGGVQMFDNDHSITFQFRLDELIFINKYWKDIVSGKLEPIMFIHDSKGDSNKKVFMMGKGLDSDNPDEVAIGMTINPTQRTGQIIFDDPIQSVLFIPTDTDVIDNKNYMINDLEKIQLWFEVAVKAKLDTSYDKSFTYSGSYGNFSRQDDGRKPKFNYGKRDGSFAPRSDRPIVSRFGGGERPVSSSPNQVKENAEELFDVDDDEVMG
jgi:hypothetical protein